MRIIIWKEKSYLKPTKYLLKKLVKFDLPLKLSLPLSLSLYIYIYIYIYIYTMSFLMVQDNWKIFLNKIFCKGIWYLKFLLFIILL